MDYESQGRNCELLRVELGSTAAVRPEVGTLVYLRVAVVVVQGVVLCRALPALPAFSWHDAAAPPGGGRSGCRLRGHAAAGSRAIRTDHGPGRRCDRRRAARRNRHAARWTGWAAGGADGCARPVCVHRHYSRHLHGVRLPGRLRRSNGGRRYGRRRSGRAARHHAAARRLRRRCGRNGNPHRGTAAAGAAEYLGGDRRGHRSTGDREPNGAVALDARPHRGRPGRARQQRRHRPRSQHGFTERIGVRRQQLQQRCRHLPRGTSRWRSTCGCTTSSVWRCCSGRRGRCTAPARWRGPCATCRAVPTPNGARSRCAATCSGWRTAACPARTSA